MKIKNPKYFIYYSKNFKRYFYKGLCIKIIRVKSVEENRKMDISEYIERVLIEAEETLKFCEMAIQNENRLELVYETLSELANTLDILLNEPSVPMEKRRKIKKYRDRANILLFRAQVLLKMFEDSKAKYSYY